MDASSVWAEAKDEASFVSANFGKVGLVLTIVFAIGLITGLAI